MKKCRLCKEPTETVFNINFKAVSVCDSCALTITQQEVSSWSLAFRPLTKIERAANKVLHDPKRSKKACRAIGTNLARGSYHE